MLNPSKRPRGSTFEFLLGLVTGLAVAGYSAGHRASGKKSVHEPAGSPRPRPIPPTPLEPTPHLAQARRARRPFGVRLAFASIFTVLFFAGAAFTAFGGDLVAQTVQSDDTPSAAAADSATASADAQSSQPAPDATVAPDAQPTPDAQAAPAADATAPAPAAAPAAAPSDATDATSVVDAQSTDAAAPVVDAKTAPASAPHSAPTQAHAAGTHASHARVINAGPAHKVSVVHLARTVTARKPAVDPEANTPGAASVVWLNRALPDPTPPASRLARPFIRNLYATAKSAGADWALVLGVLRAEGADGRFPANRATVQALATQLGDLKAQGKDDWSAAAAVVGDTAEADQAVALAHYDRAVGTETLVDGLEGSKARLVRRVLNNPTITMYPGGRGDLESGRVNVRVVTVIAYLADTFGTVDVSCLITGHRLFARPGVISAHVYGLAVDIAALGGVSIEGHQEPGGLTEHAVRALLLMPTEVEPKQIISLLGLGGPSFPLADHYDHIHVGY